MASIILRADNLTVSGGTLTVNADGTLTLVCGETGGTTVTALPEITASGTTNVTRTPGAQIWAKVANSGASMAVTLALDDTAFPVGAAAEVVIQYDSNTAFVTPVSLVVAENTLATVSLSQGKLSAIVKIAKTAGGWLALAV